MYGSLLLLSSVLLIASGTEAARTPRQRSEQRNPYIVLPPGLGEDAGEADLPRSLGEKEFVRDARTWERQAGSS
jgi:lipase ATG15